MHPGPSTAAACWAAPIDSSSQTPTPESLDIWTRAALGAPCDVMGRIFLSRPRAATCIGHTPGQGLRLGQPLRVPAKQMRRSPVAESQGRGHLGPRLPQEGPHASKATRRAATTSRRREVEHSRPGARPVYAATGASRVAASTGPSARSGVCWRARSA